MLSLLQKKTITVSEACKLDSYLINNISEFLTYDADVIIRTVKMLDEKLVTSSTSLELSLYFKLEVIKGKLYFAEELLEDYLKYYYICKKLDFNYREFAHILGTYYYPFDKDNAHEYYSIAFESGFDITLDGYFTALENYTLLINTDISDFLTKLISSSSNENNPNADTLNTYSLLINSLTTNDERFLDYLFAGIELCRKVISDQSNSIFNIDVDTAADRILCELLIIKFDYYIKNYKFKVAMECYEELTIAIRTSKSRQYILKRDMLYNRMLVYLSQSFPEVEFFKHFDENSFTVLEKINDLNTLVGKEITLQNSYKQTFKFKVVYIYKDEIIHLVPLLPIIGEGGKITLQIDNKDNVHVLYKY